MPWPPPPDAPPPIRWVDWWLKEPSGVRAITRADLARVIATGLAGGLGSDAIAVMLLREYGGRCLATVEGK